MPLHVIPVQAAVVCEESSLSRPGVEASREVAGTLLQLAELPLEAKQGRACMEL